MVKHEHQIVESPFRSHRERPSGREFNLCGIALATELWCESINVKQFVVIHKPNFDSETFLELLMENLNVVLASL